jgi:hypothetical protein
MPVTNTIPLTEAVDWVTRWRDSSENLPVKGFLIPEIDVTEVLNEEGVANIRAYMAIDPSEEYHLLIVGVDADGNDMVDEAAGQYVYDFTRPCPSLCSKTGPLK